MANNKGPHPSHVTRVSDASSYDEICVNCGAHDEVPGGWGKLADPCPNSSNSSKTETKLRLPKRVPEPGFYYHYKHNPNGPINNYAYEVIGIGFHTEDDARPGEEHFLSYRPLYESPVYIASKEFNIPFFDNRPLEMWMGDVEKGGGTFPRFRKITDDAIIKELSLIRDKMYP